MDSFLTTSHSLELIRYIGIVPTFAREFDIENEKITYLHGGESSMTYILKPTDGGTRLTYVLDSEFKSTQDKILMKIFRRLGERDLKRSLEKLKSILEK